MGDLSRQMICLIVIYLFVVCVGFPSVRSAAARPRYVSNSWAFTQTQKQSSENYFTGNKSLDAHNQTKIENMLNLNLKENNMFTRLLTLKNLKKILDSFLLLFSSFSENTNNNINHVLLSSSAAAAPTATKRDSEYLESNVIQTEIKHPGLSSTTITNGRARPKWLTLSDTSQINDFLKDVYRTKTKSTRSAQQVAGRRLQNRRRHRRSFSLWDYGFSLDDAFEDDTSDVVFGAHTSPCDIADRHYCLNGGTCVFVGALEIKTCRCKIGYTGLRCEMINQEFILALLSSKFFG